MYNKVQSNLLETMMAYETGPVDGGTGAVTAHFLPSKIEIEIEVKEYYPEYKKAVAVVNYGQEKGRNDIMVISEGGWAPQTGMADWIEIDRRLDPNLRYIMIDLTRVESVKIEKHCLMR